MTPKIKISFIGDISLNNGYINFAKKGINPFIEIQPILEKSDYVVGNLEAFTPGEKGENLQKRTRLKMHEETMPLLQNIPLNLVSLANNHVFDQLSDGFLKTIRFLDKNNIRYTGAQKESLHNKKHFVTEIKGKKIGFINYLHLATNPNFPEKMDMHVNIYNKNNIIKGIQELVRITDYLVLLLHWGKDNSRFPEPWQRKHSKEFVKAGANLIIGHHPHVLQGFEKINNSFVFYSLGNFAFAPIKDGEENDLDAYRQSKSIILHWNIDEKNTWFSWDPIILNKLSIKPHNKTNLLKITRLIPVMSNSLVWPLYSFYLRVVYKAFFYFFGNNRNPLNRLAQIDMNKIKRALSILSSK